MFNKKFEDRLQFWMDFRKNLEESATPFEDVIKLYDQAPLSKFSCDPWDKSTWASPWELLDENDYCDFSIVLGMCYSLQLTDRFKGSNFEIHISTNKEKSETHYLLFVDNTIVDYKGNVVSLEELPDALQSQTVYKMPELQ